MLGVSSLCARLAARLRLRKMELRKSALHDYTARGTYQVVDLKGKVHAGEIGQIEFHAPDKKAFVVSSESGSGVIRRMALSPTLWRSSCNLESAIGIRILAVGVCRDARSAT